MGTPVRDQGGCGSCWAETAIANMEGVHFLATGELVPLSVEQVLEWDQYDTACYGGWPAGAFKHVIEAGGIASDADYQERWNGKTICLADQAFNESCGDGMCDDPPLTNWCDVSCEEKQHEKKAIFDDWATLPVDEDAIAAILSKHGPISVAIDASGGGMGFLFPWLAMVRKMEASIGPSRTAGALPSVNRAISVWLVAVVCVELTLVLPQLL